MRYYKEYQNGALIIGTGYAGEEITEAEYNTLLSEIKEKAKYIKKLYLGEITLEDVPNEWRDEIQAGVDKRKALDEMRETEEIDGIELLNMVEDIL